MKKISVVIPIYNSEKHIEKCLESVLNQTLKEIEIIVINDGSKDNSLKKIKKYEKDDRVKIISRENEGVSFTRNEGIANGVGEYVYFLDSDDYLEKNDTLEILYNKCEKENLDILVFDYYKVINNKKEYIKNIEIEGIIKKDDYFYNVIDYNGCSIWSKIIRRNLYIKNNIKFLESIFLAEDWNISIKLGFLAEKIGKINEVFYNYVQHESQGTKTIDLNKSLRDEFKASGDLIEFLSKYNGSEEYIKAVKLKMYFKYLKKRYNNLEYYNILKKNFLKENKKDLLNCEYFKKQTLKNKVKFYFRSIFLKG